MCKLGSFRISYGGTREVVRWWKYSSTTGDCCQILIMYSVSPSPEKGHGKVAKKGHFLMRGNMSKGHF